jgi:ferredoxin
MPSDRTGFKVTLLLPDGQQTIVVKPSEHIWDAANAAGIVLPSLCHQGRCLSCAGRLDGPGAVDQTDSVSYFPEDRQAGFVLLCTGRPQSELRIRTHQQRQMREFRKEKGLPSPYS